MREGRGRRAALAGLGALAAAALAALAVLAGFVACALPGTTRALAERTALVDASPYTRGELVGLAEATRAYTLGRHSLADLLGAEAAALEAALADGRAEVEALGPAAAAAAEGRLAGMEAGELEALLGGASERLVLPARALAHLDDCHAAVLRAAPMVALAGAASVPLLAACARLGGRRGLGGALAAGGCLALALLAALALWAAADFEGLFAAFHGLFFREGTWTFPWDSLLICMYPEAFWAGMAAVWALTSGGLALALALCGLAVERSGRPRGSR